MLALSLLQRIDELCVLDRVQRQNAYVAGADLLEPHGFLVDEERTSQGRHYPQHLRIHAKPRGQ